LARRDKNLEPLPEKKAVAAEASNATVHRCPVRHAKVRMTMEERIKYRPPKGINVFFYGPSKDPKKQLAPDVCFATFYCAEINPHRNEQRYEDDLDEVLANLGRRLLNDHVTKLDCPELLERPKINMRTLVDSPLLDNDYDTQIRSRMKNVTEIPIDQQHLKAINDHLQRYRILYSSPKKEMDLKDLKEQEKRDPATGQKRYMVRFGDI
jgi:hypothetical protein